jgi:hypothetical protein
MRLQEINFQPSDSTLFGGSDAAFTPRDVHELQTQLDAIESAQPSPSWTMGAFDAGSRAAAPGLDIDLPPETPDQRRRRAEWDISANAPAYTPLDASAPDGMVDQRLAELEQLVSQRATVYDTQYVLSLFGGFFGQSDGLAKTYGDLGQAMRGDIAALSGWQGLSHDQKLDLYNRVAHEANMEVKYNVNIVYGDKTWSEAELNALEVGLQKIPVTLILDDDKLGNIRRQSALMDDKSKPVYAWTLGNGDIEFTDLGVAATYRYPELPGVTEALMHEVGHHFDDENPRWGEFMAISGWHDVGADSDFATLMNGDTVKGMALGIAEDPDGDYVVSRQYNRTYGHKAGAEFGRGDYTRQNPYDDFAESFMQYMHAPDELKANAPQKFAFIKQMLAERGADYDAGVVID